MSTVAAISNASAPRSRWYRSAGAVMAGLLVNALLSTATDMLLVAIGVFPGNGDAAAYTDLMLLFAVTYRTLFGVLGCYLAARLATTRPMAHAITLGCIGFVLGTVGAVCFWDAAAHWYSLAIIAVALPSSWLGAWIFVTSRDRVRA